MADTLADTLWRAATAVAVGDPLAIESESDGRRVKMEVVPTVDAGTGVLTIALKAESTSEGDTRSVSTTVALPGPAERGGGGAAGG
jgi:hypothetical protein